MRISSAGTITRVVLHNPNAGGPWGAARTRRALAALRALPGTMLVPTRRGQIAAQTRELLTTDTTSVFACGGDGTVSDVASGLLGSSVALGIIPCGTTNTLAYEFGIPSDPLRAVQSLVSSPAARTLNTWAVARHHLVLGVGVGWDAQLMWRTPDALKRYLAYFAFTPIGFALAAAYDFPTLIVSGIGSAGDAIEAVGTSVLVANARHWAGRRRVFPQADPADDLLDVIVLERSSRMQLCAFWLNMMLPGGNPLSVSGVRVLKLRSLAIGSSHPGGVEAHVNGDPSARTPLTIAPSGSVQVLVPSASTGARL